VSAVLVAALSSAISSAAGANGAQAVGSERFDTVVIDAGHGGSDTGASGPGGSLEKDVALAVARNLASRLRGRGLNVIMTRDSDVRVPLEQRTAVANDARGDLFVSIHANASPDDRIHGSETFFLALEATDASAAGVAERENSAFASEGAAGIDALSDPFIALLGDLISTEHLDESSAFAQRVQQELGAVPVKSRGVKQAMFVVLSGVQMPAALVEIGFVTHRGDEGVINGTVGRKAIVDALERAVTAFGERYDARRGVSAGRPDSR
jgi:N-acetylmuramoyl-L-alanine amidase